MSSRAVALLVWTLLLLAVLGLEAASRFRGSRVPSLATLIGVAMRTRSGRVGVLAAWLWLGLHYFAH
jgi:hypothetical protein